VLARLAVEGYTAAMRGAVAAVVTAVVLAAGACGPETHRPFFHDDTEDMPEFSAARLGDPLEEGSAADLLGPDERDAVRRAGLPVRDLPETPDGEARPAKEQPGGVAHAADTAGKASVALLSVGLSLGAMVAPFFAF
jgi:hypothetical protein